MSSLDWKSIPATQRAAMRSAIAAQCFGMLTQQIVSGGMLLLYLHALGSPPSVILIVLNLTPFVSSFLNIPLGYSADRIGIKKLGTLGNTLMIIGMACFAIAATVTCFWPSMLLFIILPALLIHTIGAAFFNIGWFSLLSHIVPEHLTGRYFGTLRFSWQLVSIIFYALTALLFTHHTPLWCYQAVFLIGALSVMTRYFFYRDIPEVQIQKENRVNFVASVGSALRLDGFKSYMLYLFILVCVTSNAQDMLRLSAVHGCGLGDNQVLLMTVGSMLGSLTGFRFMGRFIDRFGPPRIFLLCHFAYFAALLLFPIRTIMHIEPLPAGIIASFVLGVSSASLGLTTTAQSFLVCRGSQRTIAYACISATQGFGSCWSGFALAALIAKWPPVQGQFSSFDIVMAGLAVTVLVQVTALKLVQNGQRNKKEPLPATEAI